MRRTKNAGLPTINTGSNDNNNSYNNSGNYSNIYPSTTSIPQQESVRMSAQGNFPRLNSEQELGSSFALSLSHPSADQAVNHSRTNSFDSFDFYQSTHGSSNNLNAMGSGSNNNMSAPTSFGNVSASSPVASSAPVMQLYPSLNTAATMVNMSGISAGNAPVSSSTSTTITSSTKTTGMLMADDYQPIVDEVPLLQELGIDLKDVMYKSFTIVLNPFSQIRKKLANLRKEQNQASVFGSGVSAEDEDARSAMQSDLVGPFLFGLALAFVLLLKGKVSFGPIYTYSVIATVWYVICCFNFVGVVL